MIKEDPTSTYDLDQRTTPEVVMISKASNMVAAFGILGLRVINQTQHRNEEGQLWVSKGEQKAYVTEQTEWGESSWKKLDLPLQDTCRNARLAN